MKTFTAFAAAALVTFTLTTATANAQMAGLAAANAPAAQAGQDLVHKTGRRRNGGKIAAGIALGLFLGELAAPFEILADAYVRLLQMTVLPYVVVSLIGGVGRLSAQQARMIGSRGGALILFLDGPAIK